jgi:hypothetical protein
MSRSFKALTPKPARPRTAAAPRPQDPATGPGSAGAPADKAGKPKEIDGPQGPEPTRYGDWERGGICYDF